MSLTETYQTLQPILNAPWEEQLGRFRRDYTGALFLIRLHAGARVTEIVAVSQVELAPLQQFLLEKHAQGRKAHIEMSELSLESLCEERDPRNGNAQEGPESDHFRLLMARLRHLGSTPLENVKDWRWKGAEPQPVF